jgi:hypothetical protein
VLQLTIGNVVFLFGRDGFSSFPGARKSFLEVVLKSSLDQIRWISISYEILKTFSGSGTGIQSRDPGPGALVGI